MDNDILNAISNLLDEKLDPIKKDVSGLKEDVKLINIQQKEHGRILRILEDKAVANKADHDKLSNDLIHLSGNIENMRKDLSTVETVAARNMENLANLKIIK